MTFNCDGDTYDKSKVWLPELRPLMTLLNGIPVYDKTSYPGKTEYETFADFPDQPTVFLLDQILMQGPPTERELLNQTALAVHGFSSNSFWKQTHRPQKDLEMILQELKAMNVAIDVILSCNPGHYRLKTPRDVNEYTYVLGEIISFGGFVKNGQGLYVTVTPNPEDENRAILYKNESPHD